MNSANYVDEQIKIIQNSGVPYSEQAWQLAKLTVGWAYVFGAYGDYCDPSNRRSRARSDHPTIESKCQNFRGNDNVPGKCVGCKWFVGDQNSDQKKREGRTRFFDCRGFVYFVLHKLFGFWSRCPAGATTMWNTAANWSAKGLVKDGVPKDTLVCLFVQNGSKMEHIGFGYKGETIECSNGVEHHLAYNKKWTHWAVPKCVVAEAKPVETATDKVTDYPTLRQGSQGDIVRKMQQLLKEAGSGLVVDGIFGMGTRAALVAFQKRNGLEADGICGPKTWAALTGSTAKEGKKLNIILYNVPEKEAEALISKYSGEVVGIC